MLHSVLINDHFVLLGAVTVDGSRWFDESVPYSVLDRENLENALGSAFRSEPSTRTDQNRPSLLSVCLLLGPVVRNLQ